MKPIKARKDFTLNGVEYFVNDTVETNNIAEIIRLNEKGFIEPLTRKEISLIQKELSKKGEVIL